MKLQEWRAVAHTMGHVQLSTAIDITTPPTFLRAMARSPPGITGQRCGLTMDALWREYFSQFDGPSIVESSCSSFVLGIAWCLILTANLRLRWKSVLLGIIGAILVVLARQKWLQGKFILQNKDLFVPVFSRAGTHVVCPRKNLPSTVSANFASCGMEPERFSGDATLLDVSALLDKTCPVITAAVLHNAISACRIDLASVWRLVLSTRRMDCDRLGDAEWRVPFPTFSKDGAELLANHATRLLLVVIDTPSIAPSNEEPQIFTTFFNAGIAVIENANLSSVYPDLAKDDEKSTATSCAVQTFFSHMQSSDDAAGCSLLLFFPTEPSLQ